MKISQFDVLKPRIARSMKEVLYNENTPPPDELIIPYNQIKEDEDEEGVATARVIYVTYCPGKKVHTVNIRFRYNKYGTFLRTTMTYL